MIKADEFVKGTKGLLAGLFVIGWLLCCLAGGIYAAWWLWPTGITEAPFSQLTLAMIAMGLGSVFAVPIALCIGASALPK